MDTVKQVLQDKYFRWLDAVESEDSIHLLNADNGDGFGSGVGSGYEIGDGAGNGRSFRPLGKKRDRRKSGDGFGDGNGLGDEFGNGSGYGHGYVDGDG